MARTETIICDGCGADITTTGNSEDWRLVLAVQAKTPWYVAEGRDGGAVTDMHIPQPIARTMYFCRVDCLRHAFDRDRGSNGTS